MNYLALNDAIEINIHGAGLVALVFVAVVFSIAFAAILLDRK